MFGFDVMIYGVYNFMYNVLSCKLISTVVFCNALIVCLLYSVHGDTFYSTNMVT